MRTAEKVEKYLQSKGRTGYKVTAVKCLTTMLWNNENIVDAAVVNANYVENYDNETAPILVCFTDKNRMLISRETKKLNHGFIFTTPTYYYSEEAIELKYVAAEKCRILEYVNTTLFGKPKPAVDGDLIVDDKEIIVNAQLKGLKTVYKALMSSIEDSKFKEKKKDGGKTLSSPPPASPTGNVAEIRKLYEDGIITKEEMIDLIKSLAK